MICRGWQSKEDRYEHYKNSKKSVIDSVVVYHFNYRCRSEAAGTYGGNRKKDIGIGNYDFVYRNSDLLSRLDPGSFSGLYGGVLSFILFAGEFIYTVIDLLREKISTLILG